VSYWNPAYYGNWVGLVEFLAVIGAAIFLYLKHPHLKFWVSGIGATYLAYWAYVMIVWA